MIYIRNLTKHKEFEEYYPELDKYMQKTLALLDLKGEYDISLSLIGPIKMKRMNKQYRNIDKTTDVLSFAYNDGLTLSGDDNHDLGDIFINVNRVHSQALDYGHSIKREFCFLFVHGLLHCLGYDHHTIEEEKEMFSLQEKILGKR